VRSTLAIKSFAALFQKRAQVEGAEPSSPRARGEISYSALFFLIVFSFAPTSSKEKPADKFCENQMATRPYTRKVVSHFFL
jgi:hypothetical protein